MSDGVALLLGLLALAGVALYLGRAWLRLEREDRFRGGDAEGQGSYDDSPAGHAAVIRAGPRAQADAEREAYIRELRASGLSDDEIRDVIDSRKVVAWL